MMREVNGKTIYTYNIAIARQKRLEEDLLLKYFSDLSDNSERKEGNSTIQNTIQKF